MIPDVVAAIVGMLKAETGVTAIVPAARIFSEEIPDAEITQWEADEPRTSIVVQSSAGGSGALQRSFVQAGSSRIDLRCYGPTAKAVKQASNAVYPVLKQMRRRSVGTTLLYSVIPLVEVSVLREPDTGFRFSFLSFDVLAAEIPTA